MRVYKMPLGESRLGTNKQSWLTRFNPVFMMDCYPEVRWIGVVIILLTTNLIYQIRFGTKDVHQCLNLIWDTSDSDFEDFNNNSGITNGKYIVPNYVHFLRLGWWNEEFMFLDVLNIIAAFKNQKPDKIFIHTDVDEFSGKYWEKLLETEGIKDVLLINRIEAPDEIFNQPFTVDLHYYFHVSDILRILILMEYGGIFLDNDSYLVRSLDAFRCFEMTLEWNEGYYLGTQTLIAHKDARFLKLWLESYRNNYKPELWYYNAGEYPTMAILWSRPELIHRVRMLFGQLDMRANVFAKEWKDWKKQYSIHTFYRHIGYLDEQYLDFPFQAPEEIDDRNVRYYKTSLLEMAKSVYKFDDADPLATKIEPVLPSGFT